MQAIVGGVTSLTGNKMAKRPCLDCHRPTTGSRCPTCTRTRDAARGRRQARGYDAAHVRLRAAYQRRMNAGETFTCWRCGETIDPAAWHLGHDDHDRTRHRGPEHIPCNDATSNRPPINPARGGG